MISWKWMATLVVPIAALVYSVSNGFLSTYFGFSDTSQLKTLTTDASAPIQIKIAEQLSIIGSKSTDSSNERVDADVVNPNEAGIITPPKAQIAVSNLSLQQEIISVRLAKFEFMIAKHGLPKLPSPSGDKNLTLSKEFKKAWYLNHLSNVQDDKKLLSLANDLGLNNRLVASHFDLVRRQTQVDRNMRLLPPSQSQSSLASQGLHNRQQPSNEKTVEDQRRFAEEQHKKDAQRISQRLDNSQLIRRLKDSRLSLARVVAQRLAESI